MSNPEPTQSDRPQRHSHLSVLNTTRVLGRSAVGMRGGRVQDFYKHKDDRNETKSHGDILVQDPCGAIRASFLKCDIDEHHMSS